jgi:hypothetical protein
MRPAFNCGIVSLGELIVRALQIFEESGALNSNGRLTRQGFEKAQPFLVRVESRAMKNFQHAFDLSLGD